MKNKILIGLLGIGILAVGTLAVSQKPAPGNGSVTPPVVTPPAPTSTTSPIEYEKLSFPDNHLDTSDWLTYRNEEFGFEIKYPKGWEASYHKGPCSTAGYGIADVTFLPKIHDPNDDNGTFICIDNQTLEGLKQGFEARGIREKRRVQLNNVYGLAFGVKAGDKWRDGESFVFFKDVLYRFTDMGGKYTDIFQQILLSFRSLR